MVVLYILQIHSPCGHAYVLMCACCVCVRWLQISVKAACVRANTAPLLYLVCILYVSSTASACLTVHPNPSLMMQLPNSHNPYYRFTSTQRSDVLCDRARKRRY